MGKKSYRLSLIVGDKVKVFNFQYYALVSSFISNLVDGSDDITVRIETIEEVEGNE